MSLKNYSHEEISKMAMIELANLILLDDKKARNFKDIFEKIAELKGFTEEQKQDNIAQFYTDLNIDGRFMTTGSNVWGLRRWYPVEQIDEEFTAAPKKKKKSTKKKKVAKKEELKAEEEELDVSDDDIEVLTGDFTDGSEDDDEDGFDDFDDELDDDLYDDDEEDDDYDDDENDEEEKK